jgi:hypothetical protein
VVSSRPRAISPTEAPTASCTTISEADVPSCVSGQGSAMARM